MSEQDKKIEKLESLIAQIKHTLESRLITQQGKANIIWRDIQDAGY